MAPRKKSTPSSDSPDSPKTGFDAIGITIPDVPGVDIAEVTSISLTTRASFKHIEPFLLSPIASDIEYQSADSLLHQVMEGSKNVHALMDPLIRPIRTGLDALYALKRKLVEPWDTAEFSIKNRMSAYKVEEQRRLNEKLQSERLRIAALQKKVDEQVSKNPEAPKVTVSSISVVTSPPVRGSNSSARSVTRVKVTNLEAVIMAVAIGEAPDSILEVNQSPLNAWLKADPEAVANCPGLEVYSDVVIAGR